MFRAASDTTGEKDFKYTCTTISAQAQSPGGRLLTAGTSTCTKANPQPSSAAKVYGDYKVYSIADTSNSLTISDVASNKFTLAAAYTVAAAAQQTATQEVVKDSDDKTSFKIVLTSADAAPALYNGNEATSKTFSSCTLATDAKSVTCTPASGEMEDGKEYTIYYKEPCQTEFKTTGVKVKYSASSFVSLSKYALVVLALFLL